MCLLYYHTLYITAGSYLPVNIQSSIQIHLRVACMSTPYCALLVRSPALFLSSLFMAIDMLPYYIYSQYH